MADSVASTPTFRVDKLALTVPATQLSVLRAHAEAVCSSEKVRMRFDATEGERTALVVVEMRGEPPAVRVAKQKIGAALLAFPPPPEPKKQMPRAVRAALSFAGGLLAVGLLNAVLW